MYVEYDLEKLYVLEWHYRIIELERRGVIYYLKIKILSAQRPALVNRVKPVKPPHNFLKYQTNIRNKPSGRLSTVALPVSLL